MLPCFCFTRNEMVKEKYEFDAEKMKNGSLKFLYIGSTAMKKTWQRKR